MVEVRLSIYYREYVLLFTIWKTKGERISNITPYLALAGGVTTSHLLRER
jgi:hypothetical protein